MIKIGVLVSGRGSNLEAIIRALEKGEIRAKAALVVSDVFNAYGLQRARDHNLEAIFLDPKKFKTKEDYEQRIIDEFKAREIGLVCLAGFLRILTPHFIRNYSQRIMNIHPSLLPAFPGLNAQQKALDYGVKYSGCTVHFVDEGVDSGPIILQAVVPVKEDDTPEILSQRILREEHKIYPRAIKAFVEGRLTIKGRRVLFKD